MDDEKLAESLGLSNGVEESNKRIQELLDENPDALGVTVALPIDIETITTIRQFGEKAAEMAVLGELKKLTDGYALALHVLEHAEPARMRTIEASVTNVTDFNRGFELAMFLLKNSIEGIDSSADEITNGVMVKVNELYEEQQHEHSSPTGEPGPGPGPETAH